MFEREGGGEEGEGEREGKEESTYVWLSGRLTVTPRGASRSCSWLNNHGLAANPPTSHTLCAYEEFVKLREYRESWKVLP